ncbi:hypothetical protein ASZ90_019486 [hydrocarbon metagenome]|uniref:DUF4179 domain-containing protein n=1 Tax=hydrocarbon metagenome TaxID=938273 RepID=A0A0W8E3C3_9ZZZZ
MKREDISHSVGNISTRHIQEAENYSFQNISFTRKRFSTKKIVALVASVALFFTLAIPILAAADVQAVYEILYAVSPRIAQELKPVRMSSEDNGINMEVISAYINGDKALIYISMQDMTGERIDETTDLYDSYSINRPFSSSATCERISYDEETNTATFLISITQWGQKEIGGKKITFTVDKFLSNKQEYHDKIPQINLNLNLTPHTQSDVNMRGWSFSGDISEKPKYIDYLTATSEGSFSPIDGVTVTGVGFIAGKLHIQAYYENILETDNHGYVYLVNAAGDEIRSEASVSFWDTERSGSYEEYIFDVAPSEINNYELYGHFWTCNSLTNGDWQVTFPLKYEE